MKRICAWCKKDLGDKPGAEAVITHGICEECKRTMIASMKPSDHFLDRFSLPIVVLENGGVVYTANEQARNILGKDIPHVSGFLGGDVFECIYASLPGGCGKTEHCAACTIRNTVTDTMTTGKSHFKRSVILNQRDGQNARRLNFLISTEKVGEIVLLRIDEIK